MMLPILISVSVTPLSYFFCADAGADAAARMVREIPSVLSKSFARFIESPPAGWARRDGRQFPRFVFLNWRDDSSRRGFPEAGGGCGPAIVRDDLSRRSSALRRSKFYDTKCASVAVYHLRHHDPGLIRPSPKR